jgi:hypothetical protein
MDLLLDEIAWIERCRDGPLLAGAVVAWVMTVRTASYSIGVCVFRSAARATDDMRSGGRLQKARVRLDHMNVSRARSGEWHRPETAFMLNVC